MGKNGDTTKATQGLRWSRRERLRYLESLAYWRGWFRRSDLMQRFGIGMQHVSADISEYVRLNRTALVYDRRKKMYSARSDMRLIFGAPTMEEALTFLGARGKDQGPWVDFVRLPERKLEQKVLQGVFRAVAARRSIRVQYASLHSKSFRWRWITPHAFASDGYRWHVRAFCHEDKSFKDFVLGRIARVGAVGEPAASAADDHGWKMIANIELAPARGMNSEEVRALELDFGMQHRRLAVSVRHSLRLYALAQIGLSETGGPMPARFRLVKNQV
jgi:hypothetical protein